MSAILALAIGMLLAGANVPGQDCANSHFDLGMAYRECVEAKAGKLEPSGESAEIVASAAVTACHAPRKNLQVAVASCGGDGLADSLVTEVDHVLHDQAVQDVVEIRARRHSRAK